jgi:UDP-N-acetylglucosamine transferase subunit ALG13
VPSSDSAGRTPAAVGRIHLFVSVGTEHYPFDRLIEWMDGWLATGVGSRVDCVVQHGVGKASSRAASRAFLPFDEMLANANLASAVVCHGGTGTVMLARHAGIRPIVVPRLHGRGEHVDDHQVEFARRMAARGEVEVAESESELHRLLDSVVEHRLDLRCAGINESSDAAVARFCRLVDDLLVGSAR